MPPIFESSEQTSQLSALAEVTASSTKYSLASRASPSLFTIPHLVNLEKDVFLLPILQPCHPRLSQGVSLPNSKHNVLSLDRLDPTSPSSPRFNVSKRTISLQPSSQFHRRPSLLQLCHSELIFLFHCGRTAGPLCLTPRGLHLPPNDFSYTSSQVRGTERGLPHCKHESISRCL
jgi:hypothetical protein